MVWASSATDDAARTARAGQWRGVRLGCGSRVPVPGGGLTNALSHARSMGSVRPAGPVRLRSPPGALLGDWRRAMDLRRTCARTIGPMRARITKLATGGPREARVKIPRRQCRLGRIRRVQARWERAALRMLLGWAEFRSCSMQSGGYWDRRPAVRCGGVHTPHFKSQRRVSLA